MWKGEIKTEKFPNISTLKTLLISDSSKLEILICLRLNDTTCGGFSRGMMKSTLMGWRSASGGSPFAISIAVIPRDQISACVDRITEKILRVKNKFREQWQKIKMEAKNQRITWQTNSWTLYYNLLIISICVLNNLGRHPEWCSYKCLLLSNILEYPAKNEK